MIRKKMIKIMIQKANALQKCFSEKGWEELMNIDCEWNRTHNIKHGIYMTEHWNEDDEFDGFYIEDNCWIISEKGEQK